MVSDKSSHTAVLYFTLTPEAEAKEKNFASGSSLRSNKEIAQLLQNHTQHQIHRSGLPFFVFDEHNQAGSSFGEKITRAFIDVFKQGYDNVIAVGNDTPEIKPDHLLQTSELLESGRSSVVLGPAADGGTWLIGFNKNAFNSKSFQSLPWKSSDLFSAIIEEFCDQESITQLEYFGDIDRPEDLDLFLTSDLNGEKLLQLRRRISSLITPQTTFTGEKLVFQKLSGSFNSLLLRGPPNSSDYGHILH
jgi:glycosyltransferase A (GT-A) superfamily protein (DUF2064 family)